MINIFGLCFEPLSNKQFYCHNTGNIVTDTYKNLNCSNFEETVFKELIYLV